MQDIVQSTSPPMDQMNSEISRPKTTNLRPDYLSELPTDLQLMVLDYLSDKDLFQARFVSKKWEKIIISAPAVLPRLTAILHFDSDPLLPADFSLSCTQDPTLHENTTKDRDEKTNTNAEAVVDKENENTNTTDSNQNLDEKNSSNKASEIEIDSDDEPISELDNIEKEEMLKYLDLSKERWLHDNDIIEALYKKVKNREKRWATGHPLNRVFLPPPTLINTSNDVESGAASSSSATQKQQQLPENPTNASCGSVKAIKIKHSTMIVTYTKGTTMAVWDLTPNRRKKFKEVLRLIKAHGKANSDGERNKLSQEEKELLLNYINNTKPDKPTVKLIKARYAPRLFDFLPETKILAVASREADIEVFNLKTGKCSGRYHEDFGRITGISVWGNWVLVASGSKVSVWNHLTGEKASSGIQTWHRSDITSLFMLDNEDHLLCIDTTGAAGITSRSAKDPHLNPLLASPLYPLFLNGTDGSPYTMRLLHSIHLFVWGKFGIGHYELSEPNKPIPFYNLFKDPKEEMNNFEQEKERICVIYDSFNGFNANLPNGIHGLQQFLNRVVDNANLAGLADPEAGEANPNPQNIIFEELDNLSRHTSSSEFSITQLYKKRDKKSSYTLIEMMAQEVLFAGTILVADFRHVITHESNNIVNIYDITQETESMKKQPLYTWPLSVSDLVTTFRDHNNQNAMMDFIYHLSRQPMSEASLIESALANALGNQGRINQQMPLLQMPLQNNNIFNQVDNNDYSIAPLFIAHKLRLQESQKRQECKWARKIIDYDENIEPLSPESIYQNLQDICLDKYRDLKLNIGLSTTNDHGSDADSSSDLEDDPRKYRSKMLQIMNILRDLDPTASAIEDGRLVVGFFNGYVGVYNFV
ncbi:hypothetical protein H4219_001444 [Mycoemilia scoparia]|uniref:F-box domain-containing protein n=1 Tax=Mycoemilia scoparia TaxID=417184 RepID=A0A9W8A5U8_9FUNG|nr:hypothetical protein H4219_001444 [Mycoemilia scoparia]